MAINLKANLPIRFDKPVTRSELFFKSDKDTEKDVEKNNVPSFFDRKDIKFISNFNKHKGLMRKRKDKKKEDKKKERELQREQQIQNNKARIHETMLHNCELIRNQCQNDKVKIFDTTCVNDFFNDLASEPSVDDNFSSILHDECGAEK